MLTWHIVQYALITTYQYHIGIVQNIISSIYGARKFHRIWSRQELLYLAIFPPLIVFLSTSGWTEVVLLYQCGAFTFQNQSTVIHLLVSSPYSFKVGPVKLNFFFFFLVGKAKSQVISSCRSAMKMNDVNALMKIITHGSSNT